MTTTLGAIGTPYGIAWGSAVLLALLLVRGLSQVRGTTLWAPCVWALISTASLAGAVEFVAASSDFGLGLSALQFVAAASTLCPLMAVLGAKRPQNRGWQWVVLTLWIVVVWPAAQAVLIPTGLHVEIFVAWKLFLIGLVLVGLLNYLPTRHGLAACFFAVGQMAMLDSYLWKWSAAGPQWALAIGLSCFLMAAFLAAIRNHKTKKRVRSKPQSELEALDQRWLDFRDAFGALWALRILARVNQTAEVSPWPMRLAWSGFVSLEAKQKTQPTPKQLEEMRQTMATLLRRFV